MCLPLKEQYKEIRQITKYLKNGFLSYDPYYTFFPLAIESGRKRKFVYKQQNGVSNMWKKRNFSQTDN